MPFSRVICEAKIEDFRSREAGKLVDHRSKSNTGRSRRNTSTERLSVRRSFSLGSDQSLYFTLALQPIGHIGGDRSDSWLTRTYGQGGHPASDRLDTIIGIVVISGIGLRSVWSM